MESAHTCEKMKPSQRKKDREVYSKNEKSKPNKIRRIRKRDSED
jgi:hypothetical protein